MIPRDSHNTSIAVALGGPIAVALGGPQPGMRSGRQYDE